MIKDTSPIILISREEALAIGQTWYYTGKPCIRNHIVKRNVSDYLCRECKKEHTLKRYHMDSSAHKIRVARYKLKNDTKQAVKEYRSLHKDKLYDQTRDWINRNRDRYREVSRNWQKKQRNNPIFRLNNNIRRAIYENLKSKKERRSWISFVNFSLDDLIHHLEKQFDENMNWDNYGTYWHVDHIKPLSKFDLEKEFNKAWELSNLQPLEAIKNLKKGNKYEEN